MKITSYAPKPLIIMTLQAYQKMMGIVESDYMPGVEKMWLGRVERKENVFLITDILIAPQTKNSSVYVETDDSRFPKWAINKDPKTLRLHGHTHPNMPPNPSGTDKAMFDQLIEENHDFFIRIIVSTLGTYHLDMFIDEYKAIYTDLEYFIEVIPHGIYAKIVKGKAKLITIKGFHPNIPVDYNQVLEELETHYNVDKELKEWISINTSVGSTLYPYPNQYTYLDAEQSDLMYPKGWFDSE